MAAPARELAARVVDSREEGPGTRTLRLALPEPLRFAPGQWVMLQFPDRAEKASAYSLASSPLDGSGVELSCRAVGALSERLCAAAPGQELLLRGPYGKWVYDETIEHAVLVCEGTGLAPFRSFGRYVRDKGLKNRLTILYAGPHLLDVAELVKAGFAVHTMIGDIGQQVENWKSAHYYLCGAKALVDRFKMDLAARGIPATQVHLEAWADYAWDSF
jgi:NAD(P)H-flavin reductase